MKIINSIFVFDCEKLDDSNTYVISLGLDKILDHRYYEYKKNNVYHDAYDKLADIMTNNGFDVDIDDNWLRIFTDDPVKTKEAEAIICDNSDWLYDMFSA